MKRFAVVFDEHNARIVKGPEVDALAGKSNVLVNPVLPQGVPPHHWKLEGGKIGFHSEEEIRRREEILHGPKLEEPTPSPRVKGLSRHVLYYPLIATISSALTALILHYWR